MDDDNLLDGEFTPEALEATPEDTTPAEQDTPEVASSPTPEPVTAPVPDWQADLAAVARMQREQMERQNQPQVQAPPAWVDPYDRPDVIEKLDQLESEASWNDAARVQLRQYRRQIEDERINYRLQEQQQTILARTQAELGADAALSGLTRMARTELGDLVDEQTIQDVTNQVFGGNRALMTQALQDPAVQQLVLDAAAGRRTRMGRNTPANAPQRPPVPPQVQSSARNSTPPPPKADAVRMFNDRSYLSGVIDDLLFGKPKPDHEELLK